MFPFYKTPQATLYNADCLDVLKYIHDKQAGQFSLCFNDLPFNYQGEVPTEIDAALKSAGLRKRERMSRHYVSFIEHLTLAERGLLKPGGNLVVLNNPTNLFKTAHIYLQAGFTFRNGVPLIRPASFRVPHHLSFRHNYLWFLFTEDPRLSWYGKGGHGSLEAIDDVWTDVRYQNGVRRSGVFHPQAMREDLTRRIIE